MAFTDITKNDIQSYLLDLYSSKDAPLHQPLSSNSNRCNTTTENTSSPLLSFPQSVVHTIMKGMANTETTNRGLLVLHSTGSGKTLTATATMDAFWDTDKNIIFATSVEASNSNPPSTFHKLAKTFFPRFQGKSLEQTKKEFERRKVKYFTFATLAHYLLIANPLKRVKTNSDVETHKSILNNAILIIDEVHNIFKPLPNQKLENNAVKEFLMDYNNPHTRGLQIVILTATPGDSPNDVVSLLNMIRDKKSDPIQIPNIKDYQDMERFSMNIRGLISYFDMSQDYSRFPKIIKVKPDKEPMSVKQYVKYSDSYIKEPNSFKNANALMKENQFGKYYKHARKYSNMLYDIDQGMTINEFSSKLPALLENIRKYPHEKHYIYSSFYENRGYGQGIIGIAKALETELGFEKLSVSNADKQKNGFVIEPKSRYVLAISTELTESREKLKSIVSAFNRPENAHGEYIQIFLASQGYNEGIDLKAIRHIHMFEPLLTFAAEKQTIGRAARFCSHQSLNRDAGEWTVKIHKYISEQPEDLSMFNLNYFRDRIDYFIGELTKQEDKYEALKGLGVEYKTLRDNLKEEIKQNKTMIKDLEKKFKEVEKMNLKNVKIIDEKITKEAQQRSLDMIAIDDAMRHSSVDYLLFKDFHAKN